MSEILIAIIVSFHVLVIAIDCVGALAIATNRFPVDRLCRWQVAYLTVVFGKSLSVLLCERCPLTALENLVRSLNGVDTVHVVSFVTHYVPWLPEGIDALISFVLMLCGSLAVFRVIRFQLDACIRNNTLNSHLRGEP